MNDLGYLGWELEWSGDSSTEGYCWIDQKKISIGPGGSTEQTKYLILHEIAHIEPDPPHGNKHHSEFWRRLRFFLNRFLDGADWSSSDKVIRRVYGVE